MPEHYESPEHLVHFRCGACGGWWSIGDAPPGETWFCPWCGVRAQARRIEEKGRSMYRNSRGEGLYLTSGRIFRSHKSQGPTELATRMWGLKTKTPVGLFLSEPSRLRGHQRPAVVGDLIMAENTKYASPGMIIRLPLSHHGAFVPDQWIEHSGLSLEVLGLITQLENMRCDLHEGYDEDIFLASLQERYPESDIPALTEELVRIGYLVREKEGGR